jgi:hypothetical protein
VDVKPDDSKGKEQGKEDGDDGRKKEEEEEYEVIRLLLLGGLADERNNEKELYKSEGNEMSSNLITFALNR